MDSDNKESLLIEKIREGDEYAFEIAFLKYYTPLSKYTWKYVRSTDLAEEVVQEVFAAIWEGRRNLDSNGHLKGLLYETARNKALNYIKHQKIVEKYIAEARRSVTDASTVTMDVFDSEDKNLTQAFNEAIESLPPKAGRVYKLNQQEGLTYTEISGYLGISVKTVESQMRRALHKMRECLSEYLPFLLIFVLQWFIR